MVSIKLYSEKGKNFSSLDKDIAFIAHNIKAKLVTVNGKTVVFKTVKNNIEIPISWKKGNEIDIKIQL